MFKKRLPTTILLIAFIILVLFFLHPLFFILTCVLVSINSQHEFYLLLEKKGYTPFKKYGIFCGSIILLIQYLDFYHGFFSEKNEILLITMVIILISLIIRVFIQFSHVSPLDALTSTLSGIIYVPWLFGFIVKVRFLDDQNGPWYILMLLLVTKSTDIFAYVTGTLVGKRKLAPNISAGKTIEGAVGGLLGATIVGVLFKISLPEVFNFIMWNKFMALVVVLGVFSQIGDLFESSLKRDVGVKDSGSILPGMGGTLDLIDSLVVVSPIMYLFLKI